MSERGERPARGVTSAPEEIRRTEEDARGMIVRLSAPQLNKYKALGRGRACP
jgi:hypothetical protein